MGFFEDMKAAGLDVMEIGSDLSKVNEKKLKRGRLTAMLYAVTDLFDRNYDPDLHSKLTELRDAHKSGTMQEDWTRETAKALLAASENKKHPLFCPQGAIKYQEVIKQYIPLAAPAKKREEKKESDALVTTAPADEPSAVVETVVAKKPEKDMTASELLDEWIASHPGTPQSEREDLDTDSLLDPNAPISSTMEEKYNQVALDLEAQGLLNPRGPEYNTPKMDPHALAPLVWAMQETFATANNRPDIEKDLAELKKAYYETKHIDTDWTAKASKVLDEAFRVGYRNGKISRHGFASSYRGSKIRAEGAVKSEEVVVDDAFSSKISAIKDIQEKMKAESHGLHRNSKEYKNMVAAVNKVADMKYDPKDPESVRAMAIAMNELNKAADAYAEKEAYKEKKTDRGIERRNTALSLLAITDAKGLQGVQAKADAKGMTDFRVESTGLLGKKGTRTTLSELVGDEQKKTHDLADKRRAARKAAQKDQQPVEAEHAKSSN